ncbi:hypothetical protein MJT46_003994 [Ovis ammon polii x Ovis aries]|nr:hypothetical protein MJT46_003994 [Ovis ammon polii x Ovis aries]
MLIEAALSLLMRTRDSGDCTMNSGSCLSASTVAFPTITGSSMAMSAYSSSNASAFVRMPVGPSRVDGQQCSRGRSLGAPLSPVPTTLLDATYTEPQANWSSGSCEHDGREKNVGEMGVCS